MARREVAAMFEPRVAQSETIANIANAQTA
jgi:hypothetical protein